MNEQWVTKKIKDLTSKIIDNRGKTPPYNSDDGIELIETASISFVPNYPNYSKVTKFVSELTFEKWFRDHPQKDDLLISTVGEYSGSTAIMEKSRGTIAQNLIAIRPKNIAPKYLYYWTKTDNYKKQLNEVMMNQAQPSLRVPWLMSFDINYPKNLTKQNEIVSLLSEFDSHITSLQKLVAKKSSILQGVMKLLLNGEKRLPGFNQGWEPKKLGEVVSVKTGKKDVNEGHEDGAYPFFTCSRDISFSDTYSFSGEAILIAGNGEVGHLQYYKGNFEAYQRTYILQNFQVEGRFLWYQLLSKFKNSLAEVTIGSTIPYIKKENISNFTFDCPIDKNEQIAIATVLTNMSTEILENEKLIAKYQFIKQSALQHLLTGKIRLV